MTLALLQPQKARGQETILSPFRDCGHPCAGNTFKGRADFAFMEQEIWKPIAGYEGSYAVSNLGRVLGLDRLVRSNVWFETTRIQSGCVLKPVLSGQNRQKWGRLRVNLWKQGKIHGVMVHRLVCSAFHPNPFNYPEVNHKDGNRLNNRSDNLEWCTTAQNKKHAQLHGLNGWKSQPGTENGNCKLTEEQVLQVRQLVKTQTKNTIARMMGVSWTQINRIVKGQSWKFFIQV